MRRRPTGKLPDKGKPNSYGYDENGDRLPYAISRPSYSKDQVDKVWDRFKDENGEVWVLDKYDSLVKIEWRLASHAGMCGACRSRGVADTA